MMLKKFLMVGVLAAGLATAKPVAAADILFDGNGGGDSFGTVALLDWAAGNAIAVGVSANSPVNTTFQLYYQANLAVAQTSGGATVYNNNSGPGGSFDSLTVVLGFQEKITATSFDPTTNTGSFTFDFVPGGVNFFRIYANTDPGDNLTGVCFVCGNIVMQGTIIPNGFVSDFTAKVVPVDGSQDLDQAGGLDNYPTVDSIRGTGSVDLRASVQSYDTNYFRGLPLGTIINLAFANANTTLPFGSVDPSACFLATAQTGSLIAPNCTGGFVGVGSVGALNGRSTSNLMFQADGNSSFTSVATAVPEPATLTLLGLGMIGAVRARRRQNKK